MAPNDQEDDESASEKEENGLNTIETQATVRCGVCWWLRFCLLRNELLVVLIHGLFYLDGSWDGMCFSSSLDGL